MSRAAKKPIAASGAGPGGIDQDLLSAVYKGDAAGAQRAIEQGANVNAVHEQTGLSPLHIAVGTNNLALVRYLIEEAEASLQPDRSGRWPTLIAAQCQVSEELCDYIVAQEAKVAELDE